MDARIPGVSRCRSLPPRYYVSAGGSTARHDAERREGMNPEEGRTVSRVACQRIRGRARRELVCMSRGGRVSAKCGADTGQ